MNRRAIEGIEMFLDAIGIDIQEAGMEKTPERVVTLFEDLFRGTKQTDKDALGDCFPTDYQGLVGVANIPFYSVCEHHLMPFFGMVDIVYEPVDGKVAGLGRLSKLVDVYGRRPQLQERMASQIADAIERELGATGVMVRMRATHLCMLMKGEVSLDTKAVTMECRGSLLEPGTIRDEGLILLGGNEHV